MNIGFEAKRVFENRSGLGNYSRNTINMLARFYPENKYLLFAPKNTSLYTLPDSAEIITPKSGFSKFFKSYWRLHQVTNLLPKNKVDIFHGLSHALPYGIGKTGIPSVVTIHDLIFLRFPEYYKKFDRTMYTSIYRSSCQSATKIIAISNQTRIDLITYFGIEPGKIEVIYQSCDNRFYDKISDVIKASVRLKFNLPEKFILSVGTIEQRKNQLVILKAVAKEKLEIEVVILGKPTDYVNELKHFMKEYGMHKQVRFLQNTTTEELQAIYQMAEVMVYPSFFEGFGLPVLEAQASGCPVITSNISSLPEAGGDGALYIDPENISDIGHTISAVLSSKEFRNELILKGKDNAELFREKFVAKRLMDFYNTVVNEF